MNSLVGSDVHVWVVSLKQPASTIQSCWKILSAAEQQRAKRFLVLEPQHTFVIARAALRTLLAKYLHCLPQDLNFQQNPHGKLYLENSTLEFNLSHSHDLALLAFTLNRPIGVDIEYMRENIYAEDIARRFFSPQEVVELLALPAEQQQSAFFNCWSRKEALIKAIGSGIFYPLDQFSVAVDCLPAGEKMLKIYSTAEQAKNWKLYALDIAPNYAAAVVVAGEINKLKIFHNFLHGIDCREGFQQFLVH